jgi:diguanylate cyclase (GGDEF)-like protein
MDAKLNDEQARVAALSRYQVADTGQEEQFVQITNLVRAALGVPMAAVLLVGAERISYKAAVGLDGSGNPRRDAFCNTTIKGREPLIVTDAVTDQRFAANPYVLGPPFVRAYLGVPLKTPDGYNIGTVCAIDTAPREFTQSQIKLMEHLGELAMEQIELRQIANTDPLTGTLTRRSFMREVEREFSRSTRYERPSALVFVDLDHFKGINDTLGHAAGDVVLKTVAQASQTTLRDSDALGRLGGEEFGVLLPETPTQEALQCAERLRQTIEKLDVVVDGGAALRITASFGVASLTDELATPAMWFAAADIALYQAKRSGRNRVVSADLGILPGAVPKPAMTDRAEARSLFH